MNARNWIVPGLVFFAGAAFGRLFGVKPLVKGAMTAATVAGLFPVAEPAPARRITHRPARRRAARRSSKA
jgi:hypothetical protein